MRGTSASAATSSGPRPLGRRWPVGSQASWGFESCSRAAGAAEAEGAAAIRGEAAWEGEAPAEPSQHRRTAQRELRPPKTAQRELRPPCRLASCLLPTALPPRRRAPSRRNSASCSAGPGFSSAWTRDRCTWLPRSERPSSRFSPERPTNLRPLLRPPRPRRQAPRLPPLPQALLRRPPLPCSPSPPTTCSNAARRLLAETVRGLMCGSRSGGLVCSSAFRRRMYRAFRRSLLSGRGGVGASGAWLAGRDRLKAGLRTPPEGGTTNLHSDAGSAYNGVT